MIDDLPDLLTLLIIFVAVPLNWFVTGLLWRLHHADPKGAALRIMGIASTCVALTVTVFAIIFVNNGMDDPLLTPRETMIVTRGALLVLSVIPPALLLWWYRRKNGHEDPPRPNTLRPPE